MISKVIIGISSIAIVFIIFYCLKDNSESSSIEIMASNLQIKSQEYKHWSISKLSNSLSNMKSNQLAFLDENSMKGTYIELRKGESFKRKAVTDDIYYLYSGSCSENLSNAN